MLASDWAQKNRQAFEYVVELVRISIIPRARSLARSRKLLRFFPDPTDHPWVAELSYS